MYFNMSIGGIAISVALRFIDFIVTTPLVKTTFPDCYWQGLQDQANLLGEGVCHGNRLVRNGPITSVGIEAAVTEWTNMEFELPRIKVGKLTEHKCCVIEHLLGGPLLPCDWVEITNHGQAAFLQRTTPGPIVRPVCGVAQP
jgi:hypothetical protein